MRYLILLSLLYTLGCDDKPPDLQANETGAAGLQLDEYGSSVVIDDSWKACKVTEDCIQVDTSCDGCCGLDAISASREEDYMEEREKLCADYEGGVCDCAFPEGTAMCIDGICTFVEN